MRSIYLFFSIVLIIPNYVKAKGANALGEFLLYGGFNKGSYIYHQAPLEYRAFEFNNYVNAQKKMVPTSAYSGKTLGTVLNFSGDATKGAAILFALEFNYRHTPMSGTRDSAGVMIAQGYDQRVRTFYVGMGLGTPARKENGQFRRLWVGYLAMYGNPRLKLFSTYTPAATPESIFYTGKSMTLRHTLLFRLQLVKRLSISVMPYFEHPFLAGGPLEANYEGRGYSITEYFTIKNAGLNLCAGISF